MTDRVRLQGWFSLFSRGAAKVTPTYFEGYILIRTLITIVLGLFVIMTVEAKIWQVSPGQNLQQIIDNAGDGDQVVLAAGQYNGGIIINKAVRLSGEEGAVIDAGGQHDGVRIKVPGAVVENLKIVNFGDDLTAQNAGIYAEKQATDLILQNNHIAGDGFGIYLDKTRDIKVLNNRVTGNDKLRSPDRGNGIHLTVVQNVEVRGNTVSKTRDGLYILTSTNNILAENTMFDLRYGIHYMYSHTNEVVDNTVYRTRVGYALMSSRNLTVKNNKTTDTEDYGFLLNFITYSNISGNHVEGVWTKPELQVQGREGKALFVYNSLYNTIYNNLFAKAQIGIHLTAGSENNKIYGNRFVANPIQVKYVATREQEWSVDNTGNYWSNYLGWDMDSNGRGDVAFEPNDGIDKLLWEYPEAKVLMDSPAVLVLRWVQRQFPVLKPPGVKDSHPLMSANKIKE